IGTSPGPRISGRSARWTGALSRAWPALGIVSPLPLGVRAATGGPVVVEVSAFSLSVLDVAVEITAFLVPVADVVPQAPEVAIAVLLVTHQIPTVGLEVVTVLLDLGAPGLRRLDIA